MISLFFCLFVFVLLVRACCFSRPPTYLGCMFLHYTLPNLFFKALTWFASVLVFNLQLEVMGLLQGKVDGDTMWVMDSFALPVEGTETRVNAQA